MAKRASDWFLKEWLEATGKKQSDIVADLDWNKARISLMVRGEQQYTRDAVNELAAYLDIEPYELLMHPEDAVSLRQFRQDAVRVAELSRDIGDISIRAVTSGRP